MIGTVLLEVGKQVTVALIVYGVQEIVSYIRSKMTKDTKKKRTKSQKKQKRK